MEPDRNSEENDHGRNTGKRRFFRLSWHGLDGSSEQQGPWQDAIMYAMLAGLVVGIFFASTAFMKDLLNTDNSRKDDSWYSFIFTVNCLFAIGYVIKGFDQKNPYYLAVVVLSVAPFVIYVIADYSHADDNKTFKLVRLIVAVVFGVVINGCGFCYAIKFFLLRKKYLNSERAATRQHSDRPATGQNSDRSTTGPNSDSSATGQNSDRSATGPNSDSSATGRNSDKSATGQKSDRTATGQNSDRTATDEKTKKYIWDVQLFNLLLSVNLQIDSSASALGYDVVVQHCQYKRVFVVFPIIFLVAIAACLAGYFAVKKEKKKLAWAFAVLSALMVGGGLYVMVMSINALSREQKEITVRVLYIVATSISTLMIFFRVITCTACCLRCRKFGQGLRGRVNQSQTKTQPLMASQS